MDLVTTINFEIRNCNPRYDIIIKSINLNDIELNETTFDIKFIPNLLLVFRMEYIINNKLFIGLFRIGLPYFYKKIMDLRLELDHDKTYPNDN